MSNEALKVTTRDARGETGEKGMSKDTALARADQQYTAAYAMHYKTRNLHEALGLYTGIVAAHPDTQEADYSRMQIQNIVRRVVPKQELEDAQVSLAHAHLGQALPPDVKP